MNSELRIVNAEVGKATGAHVHHWNPAVVVRGTDVVDQFEVRIFIVCRGCGIPLKFADGAKVAAEQCGLVGSVVAEVAGD